MGQPGQPGAPLHWHGSCHVSTVDTQVQRQAGTTGIPQAALLTQRTCRPPAA